MQDGGPRWSLPGIWEPYAFAKALKICPLFCLSFPFSCLLCLLSCPWHSPFHFLCLTFLLSPPFHSSLPPPFMPPAVMTDHACPFHSCFSLPPSFPLSVLGAGAPLLRPQWFIPIKLDSLSYGGKRQLPPHPPPFLGLPRCSDQAPSVAFIRATGEHFAALGRQSSVGTRRECGLFGQLDILILIELLKGIRGMGVGESGRENEVGHGGAHAGTCPVSLGSWHCCRGESRQTDVWDLLPSGSETLAAQRSKPSLSASSSTSSQSCPHRFRRK